MKLSGQAVLLRVFIGETDRHDGRLLYEEIVRKANALNIAGATVLRGMMGYGARSRVHTAKLLRLSEDLPVVIELVDTPDKLAPLEEYLDEVVDEGLVTKEAVDVAMYRSGKKALRL